MKTLLLIRHAKSSWDNFSVADEDRPLNSRGLKNAPEMARRLLHMGVRADRLVTSTALRALTTAQLFAEEFDIDKATIIKEADLYMANGQAFTSVIRDQPKKCKTLAVFSHNNGITEYANGLSSVRIDDMPTCGVFAVACKIDDWMEFQPMGNEFLFFEWPKKNL